jgi:hypothetical protein
MLREFARMWRLQWQWQIEASRLTTLAALAEMEAQFPVSDEDRANAESYLSGTRP